MLVLIDLFQKGMNIIVNLQLSAARLVLVGQAVDELLGFFCRVNDYFLVEIYKKLLHVPALHRDAPRAKWLLFYFKLLYLVNKGFFLTLHLKSHHVLCMLCYMNIDRSA